MRGIARASLWLATLTLCAISTTAKSGIRIDPEPAWRRTNSVFELTEILERWLDENADLVRRDAPPEVRSIGSATVAFTNANAGRGHGRTRGLYEKETSTVYLIQPWNPKNAEDVSVLLHELVHHRQAPYHYYCPGAQEEAAYRLQDQWLRQRGLKANVNWIAVVLDAGCTPRDIHPD